MQIENTMIDGVKIIEFDNHPDARGTFIKTFNDSLFIKAGLDFSVKEIFYSVSNKNVIRGMHLQIPPHAHDKIVHVQRGEVIDVLLDLRKDSSTYNKCIEFNLSGDQPKALFIPKGLAHGFMSLVDDTIMIYHVSEGYNPECDTGILYNSIPYDWKVKHPTMSERDKSFLTLEEWEKTFREGKW